MTIRTAFLALALAALAALSPSDAAAQTSPGLVFGQVPTAAQWNSYFTAKQDYLGYQPAQSSCVTANNIVMTSAANSVACAPGLFGSASNNLGIGAAPNAGFRLDITYTVPTSPLRFIGPDGAAASVYSVQQGHSQPVIGQNYYQATNTSAATINYAQTRAGFTNATAGSETGYFDWYTYQAGAFAQRFLMGGGFYASGLSDPGAGGGNFTALQINNVPISLIASNVRTPILQTGPATNAATAAGNNVLHFAAGTFPNVIVGQFAQHANIPTGTVVTAVSSNSASLSANVTGGGVGNGDNVTFYGLSMFLTNSGNDANPCSVGSPCLTRARAYNLLRSAYDLSSCQPVFINLAAGAYSDSMQVDGTLVGQCNAQQVTIQGDCANPTAVLIQPTPLIGYVMGVNGVWIRNQCQVGDMTPSIATYPNSADLYVGATGSRLFFGPGMTFGCNFGNYNDVTIFNNSYAEFDNDFTIDVSRCSPSVTATYSMGTNQIVVSPNTNGIVPTMGIASAGVPTDALVTAINSGTNTITFSCYYTNPCQTLSAQTGTSTVFAGGGQDFLDTGNGAQVYFATNGNPAASLIVHIPTYVSYNPGFIFANDNSSINVQGMTFENAGFVRGPCGPIAAQSSLDTNFEGRPYMPCLAVATGPTTRGTATISAVSSSTVSVVLNTAAPNFIPVTLGQSVNQFTNITGTFTAGDPFLTLTSPASTSVVGAAIKGNGILGAARISSVAGGGTQIFFNPCNNTFDVTTVVTNKCVFTSTPTASFTGSIAMVGPNAVLSVSAVGSGSLAQQAGVWCDIFGTSIPTNVRVTGQLTGSAGSTGTYSLALPQGTTTLTVGSEAMTCKLSYPTYLTQASPVGIIITGGYGVLNGSIVTSISGTNAPTGTVTIGLSRPTDAGFTGTQQVIFGTGGGPGTPSLIQPSYYSATFN